MSAKRLIGVLFLVLACPVISYAQEKEDAKPKKSCKCGGDMHKQLPPALKGAVDPPLVHRYGGSVLVNPVAEEEPVQLVAVFKAVGETQDGKVFAPTLDIPVPGAWPSPKEARGIFWSDCKKCEEAKDKDGVKLPARLIDRCLQVAQTKFEIMVRGGISADYGRQEDICPCCDYGNPDPACCAYATPGTPEYEECTFQLQQQCMICAYCEYYCPGNCSDSWCIQYCPDCE